MSCFLSKAKHWPSDLRSNSSNLEELAWGLEVCWNWGILLRLMLVLETICRTDVRLMLMVQQMLMMTIFLDAWPPLSEYYMVNLLTKNNLLSWRMLLVLRLSWIFFLLPDLQDQSRLQRWVKRGPRGVSPKFPKVREAIAGILEGMGWQVGFYRNSRWLWFFGKLSFIKGWEPAIHSYFTIWRGGKASLL